MIVGKFQRLKIEQHVVVAVGLDHVFPPAVDLLTLQALIVGIVVVLGLHGLVLAPPNHSRR